MTSNPQSRITVSTAFTLIELLVVIAILLILLALLMPVLSRAKFSAHVVSCMSQQRQWGMALNLFADDHAGAFPNHPIPVLVGRNPWGIGAEFYDDMTGDYNVPASIHGCVMKPVDAEWVTWFRTSHGMTMLGYSYWVPHACSSGPMVDPAVAGPASLMDEPAFDRPLLTDFAACKATPWHERTCHVYNGELVNMNHLYVDGHVVTVPATQITERQNYHYRVFY